MYGFCISTQYPICSVRDSHSLVYFITSLRQAALYSSTEMVLPISSFVIPSIFSTPSSTGRPCVSHPAFLSTRNPFCVLYLQNTSFRALAITWCIPGMPLAEGGPSRKINFCAPSLCVTVWIKQFSLFHFSNIERFISTRSKFLYSANLIVVSILNLQRYDYSLLLKKIDYGYLSYR